MIQFILNVLLMLNVIFLFINPKVLMFGPLILWLKNSYVDQMQLLQLNFDDLQMYIKDFLSMYPITLLFYQMNL